MQYNKPIWNLRCASFWQDIKSKASENKNKLSWRFNGKWTDTRVKTFEFEEKLFFCQSVNWNLRIIYDIIENGFLLETDMSASSRRSGLTFHRNRWGLKHRSINLFFICPPILGRLFLWSSSMICISYINNVSHTQPYIDGSWYVPVIISVWLSQIIRQ